MHDPVHDNLLPTALLKDRRESQPIASIEIDCAQAGHDYERFWQSTGFSAAVLTGRPDMRQTLALCRGMAHGGFTYIRPHYLLNLVVVPDRDGDDYDWRRLDSAIDSYVANGFKLIFELMGYPAKRADQEEAHEERFQAMNVIPETCFDDLDDPEQVRAWYRLVRALAGHLIERYGAEELRSWWFETWNEPNIGFWKWSYAAFLNYWDACSEALRAVDPELRFGGPGNHVAWSEHLFDTLQHCLDGENFITG
ncbi:MAG: GH39 family glycosyl hydrolase, partial [Planctomycetota bacterium]